MVFLKCEFLHPGRSHKARVARSLIDDAEARGEISAHGDRILLERTGGNLGIALAVEAGLRGYKLTLVTDPGYSQIKKDIAARLGAEVIDRGISYPDCESNQDVIDILLGNSGNRYYYLNQFHNPANPRAHETGTGAEILSQLAGRGYGRETTIVLVLGLGTGASMLGISATLRTWFKRVLSFGVEPAQCDLLMASYALHPFQGIAVGEPPPFFDVHSLDTIVTVSEDEAGRASQELLRQFRFLVGPSSAANYAATHKAERHPLAQEHPDTVFVSLLYDRGEDY
jgi:cysteine synthase A